MKSFPLYSTGSNGLPLEKIARPFKFTKPRASNGTGVSFVCTCNRSNFTLDESIIMKYIYLGPVISFFSCALGLRGWVGESHNKRSLHVIHVQVQKILHK